MILFRAALLAPLALALGACAPDPAAPEPESETVTETTDAAPLDWPYPTLGGARPLVIAHRGASGERPEHTIAAYELAVEQGADCIEPDLVVTKDGVLVSRHDIYLSTTTDVADRPEFAGRKRPAPDEAHAGMEDWWVADFTLEELKTLRARQPFDGRPKDYDGQFEIPTFEEVIETAYLLGQDGQPVCIYPEAKAPAYHLDLGHDMVEMIASTLADKWVNADPASVFIQSFEPPFVKRMKERNTGHPIIMLAGDAAAYEAARAHEGAPFWDGAGVTHAMIANPDGSSTGFIERAHGIGIAVHTWTYRDDAPFGDAPIEDAMRAALRLGLDGYFTDFPATGRRVVDEMADPNP